MFISRIFKLNTDHTHHWILLDQMLLYICAISTAFSIIKIISSSEFETKWMVFPEICARKLIKLINVSNLSIPVVLLNSPSLSLYFSLNKFERILFLIFSSLLCLITSHFLITKCLILYVLCKKKLVVDNWLGLKGLNNLRYQRNRQF